MRPARAVRSSALSRITLVQNKLNGIAIAVDLSCPTLSKIRQNLSFGFVYNMVGIPLAVRGFLNPVNVGAAITVSSGSVVGNALLLKRWRPGR